MRTKVLIATDVDGETEVARFTLADDGTLTSTYAQSSSAMLREMHEMIGLRVPGARNVLPDDGRGFFDALDRHYARSTVLHVRTVAA